MLRCILRHYRPLTVVIIAATAFGCRTTNERNAYVQLSETMVALDQAKVVMSAVEDPELNAAPLDAWIHLAETYDLMTEIVDRYPDTRIAAALERSVSDNHANPKTASFDSMLVREKIHGLALGFLVQAINEGAEADAWEDACSRAPSNTWTLMCLAGWDLLQHSEKPCFWCSPELSSFVAHEHGRYALRHFHQLESDVIRLTALSRLAVALAWANAPELALEAADVLAELEVSVAAAQEEIIEDEAAGRTPRLRIFPGTYVAKVREGMIEAQATFRDIEGVLVTLDHLGPEVRTNSTRSALIGALSELGDTLERRRALDRILPFIEPRSRNEFLDAVAVAVARTGDIQAAREIMDRITEPDIIKMGVLQAKISTAQAAAGDRAGALRALQPVTDSITALQPLADKITAHQPKLMYEQSRRLTALGELAAAHIRAGNREAALVLASEMSALDSLHILPPVARALAAEGDLVEALEMLAPLVGSTQRAAERREVWGDGVYVALASYARLAEARIKAGDLEGALTTANHVGPDSYTGGRIITRIATEQARLGDHAGALATALRIPAYGEAYVAIEVLTVVALSFPESDEVRSAIEELQLTASPFGLTMAYAALRDWRRSISLAATLKEREFQVALNCILRMYGPSSDLSCLTQVDL